MNKNAGINILIKWVDKNSIPNDVLPRNTEKLENLTILDLNYSEITELPKEIVHLTKLTTLCLNRTKIKFLPDEIGNLINLTSLWINDSDLIALPSSIGNLQNLEDLHLDSLGNLKKLPDEITKLTKLKCFSYEKYSIFNENKEQWIDLTEEQEKWLEKFETTNECKDSNEKT